MLNSKSLLVFILVILAAGPSIVSAQENEVRRPIGVDDLFDIKALSDPQISPDGQWVAYTIKELDLKKDKSETRIWMTPLSQGEAIPMTAKGYSASRPRWSPDGKYLSFLASRDKGKSQVWTLNRMGGDAQQLTSVKQGVESYDWSPDGSRLVLEIKDEKKGVGEEGVGEEGVGEEGVGEEGVGEEDEDEDEEKPVPYVIDRLQFKRDYTGYLDDRKTHLYVLDVKSGGITQITSGNYDESSSVWSPNGKQIAFVSNRTENPDGNSDSNIWIVSAGNTDKGQTLLQVTTNPGSDSSPAWSPDGTWITYVSVTEPDKIWYATNHLALASAKGGEARIVMLDLDRNTSSPIFSADGKSIFFILEDQGQRHLAQVNISGKTMTRPIAGERSVNAFDLHSDGAMVSLLEEPHMPNEIYRAQDGALTPLTFANKALLDKLKLAAVEKITFNSKDGQAIEGFIYTPPDYDADFRYPTLLRIHGGPVAQYDFGFSFEAQLFAAHGYVVVTTNPRGSSGYGQDFSYALWQDWGNKDFEDVMAGVDYAIEAGFADEDRLGVGGWSYGGILTNYVITKTDRFRAAITGASEVLYISNYGHDHYQHEWEKELGLPWENREAWERISPFNSVEKIVTPTLIIGGEKDWNVPIQNSEQLYQALKRLGRTTQLVVYPGEHHGISRPSFQKDRYERYLKWYDKYVKCRTAECKM